MIDKKCTTPLDFYGGQPAGKSVDDYTTMGIYFFSYGSRPNGLPSEAYGNGWLIVIPAATTGYEKQIWLGIGANKTHSGKDEVFMRGKYSDNGWSEWVRISTSTLTGEGYKCSPSVKGVAA